MSTGAEKLNTSFQSLLDLLHVTGLSGITLAMGPQWVIYKSASRTEKFRGHLTGRSLEINSTIELLWNQKHLTLPKVEQFSKCWRQSFVHICDKLKSMLFSPGFKYWCTQLSLNVTGFYSEDLTNRLFIAQALNNTWRWPWSLLPNILLTFMCPIIPASSLRWQYASNVIMTQSTDSLYASTPPATLHHIKEATLASFDHAVFFYSACMLLVNTNYTQYWF